MTIRKWGPAVTVCLTGFAAAVFGGEPLRFDFSVSPLEAKMAEVEKSRELVQTPRCPGPPTVDGALDDAAWDKSATLKIPGGGGLGETRLRVCYDDTALYLAVECLGGPKPGTANEPVRDSGDIFDADHIELFLAPRNDGTDYQFAMDPRGLI